MILHSEEVKGTIHEMEHTDSVRVAHRTALDHLQEHPRYYTRLEACGLSGAPSPGGGHGVTGLGLLIAVGFLVWMWSRD